jgi:hypothetical protein
MALIPKGRYRGMVLVWTTVPVLGRHPANPPLQSSEYTSFQPYSIIDPSDAPTVTDPLAGGPRSFRYRNFLMPVEFPALQPVNLTPTLPPPFNPPPSGVVPGTDALGLFCSGHAWSSFGDLVVVGGTDFDLGRVSSPPQQPPPQGWAPVPYLYAGTKLSYVFNPRLDPAAFPGTVGSMYPGFQGLWQPGPNLERYRWYPTALLTHRIQRSPVNDRELMLVLGGSRDDNNDPFWDIPAHNPQWNDYEALIVQAESTAFSSNLARDVFNGVSLWLGPGTQAPPLVEEDWFEEYPRCHLMSTGQVLFTGYAPRWAALDPEVHGLWDSALLQQVTGVGGQVLNAYTSNWFDPSVVGSVGYPRHDGTSILFPNFGGAGDVVMRIGGADDHFYSPSLVRTTPTVETLQFGGAGQWESAPSMPSTHSAGSPLDGGRVLANAVILPTGAVVVIGGVHYFGPGLGTGGVPTPVMSPVVFEGGKWTVVPPNPVSSVRDYHSTAVLLDDGRIFMGGGEGRGFDYEILSPPYMSMVRPSNLVWQGSPPPVIDPFMGARVLSYAQRFSIHCDRLPVGVAVDKVVLTSPCSITHHSDMHQRYFEMKTSVNNGNEVEFDTPDNDKMAPRGLYMLWLVTNSGAPSRADWVVLR